MDQFPNINLDDPEQARQLARDLIGPIVIGPKQP
jgi:hypothetical protein